PPDGAGRPTIRRIFLYITVFIFRQMPTLSFPSCGTARTHVPSLRHYSIDSALQTPMILSFLRLLAKFQAIIHSRLVRDLKIS
ncbi:MAG: hypothetical protein NTX50_11880, partial [Candidatus Sumerlaeota bacterium]|nr:hypothetical protein [Candidatus Sumerlaeota bacterium]